MSMPGWYPDPAGQQGRFRYWDGHGWSTETTADPQHSPAPGGVPGPDQPNRGRRPGGALVAAIAAVVVVALALWWLLGRGGGTSASAPEDTNTATPTVSAWNEKSSSPTPEPSASEQPSGAAMVDCPDTGGTVTGNGNGVLQGGGLEVDDVPGWSDGTGQFDMGWAYNTESQTSVVMSGSSGTWFSVVSLSAIHRADGFTGAQQAARGVMSCFATSSYYAKLTGTTQLMAKAVTIGGRPGYRVRDEVHVSDPGFPGIAGDVVDVIVVDTGDAQTFGLFVSSYTIGDSQRQPLVDACIASLRLG